MLPSFPRLPCTWPSVGYLEDCWFCWLFVFQVQWITTPLLPAESIYSVDFISIMVLWGVHCGFPVSWLRKQRLTEAKKFVQCSQPEGQNQLRSRQKCYSRIEHGSCPSQREDQGCGSFQTAPAAQPTAPPAHASTYMLSPCLPHAELGQGLGQKAGHWGRGAERGTLFTKRRGDRQRQKKICSKSSFQNSHSPGIWNHHTTKGRWVQPGYGFAVRDLA